MSEIEKMYRNAGIKKVRQTNIVGGDYPIAVGFENYPPFTSEKQLELIKWLSKRGGELATVEINFYDNDCFQVSNIEKVSSFESELEQALASLINNLWSDLSEEERKQIKEILE